MTKKILDIFDPKIASQSPLSPPPIWMMRQAGRYLPEYRETRKKAGSFLDLCYNPELSFEVTMQPIRRFGFDAAILFSDILVVPHALGRDLHFEEGRGPIMTPIVPEDILKLETDKAIERLSPSFETLKLLKKGLPEQTALIGFCGAPWTVATYMIAGHGTSDQAPARIFGFSNPSAMTALLETLADISADYLIKQIESGAELVQIFDSWSGVLDEDCFENYCVKPVKQMVAKIKARFPKVPIIGFPKGAGLFLDDYVEKTKVDALGLDWTVPLKTAKALQKKSVIQGNLDPLRLIAGGDVLRAAIQKIKVALDQGPFIFNLGHGITPNTPLEHVEQMIKLVREN